MKTIPNLEAVIHQVRDACHTAEVLDVDSTDEPGEVTRSEDGRTETASFTMTQGVFDVIAGTKRRGAPSTPRGVVTYEVTVVARYEPFDDDK